MNRDSTDELGYSVYYDEMAKFLSQKNLPSSELEIIIQNMWNSIDQLQKKIYHDKAKKGKKSGFSVQNCPFIFRNGPFESFEMVHFSVLKCAILEF